jgi:hypothetical protein
MVGMEGTGCGALLRELQVHAGLACVTESTGILFSGYKFRIVAFCVQFLQRSPRMPLLSSCFEFPFALALCPRLILLLLRCKIE